MIEDVCLTPGPIAYWLALVSNLGIKRFQSPAPLSHTSHSVKPLSIINGKKIESDMKKRREENCKRRERKRRKEIIRQGVKKGEEIKLGIREREGKTMS